MQIKSQPWIHSWYGDSLGFFAIPLVVIFLAVFQLPPFRHIDSAHIGALITYVLIIDWAHIFAQWHRIYSNPLEISGKWIYPLSYFLLLKQQWIKIVRISLWEQFSMICLLSKKVTCLTYALHYFTPLRPITISSISIYGKKRRIWATW